MILNLTYLKQNWVKVVVPIGIIFALGYLNYAINYSLGYQEIYQHHSNSIAIILWILTAFCQVVIFIYWAFIFLIGPGKSPNFPPLNLFNQDTIGLTPIPDIFFCDESGYPYWDSETKSIKVARSFYSKDMGYNVLKFDHYCLWVGSSIGQDNYLFFMKFTMWFLNFFIIALIMVSKFTNSSIERGEINHNFIVIYIMSGFWILMLSALFCAHLKYIWYNITTLDEITINQRKRYQRYINRSRDNNKLPKCLQSNYKPRKELGIRYVNVKKDDFRLVVKFDISEYPFNMGVKKNLINLIFNGNRNHGLENSEYTTWRFIKALVIFCIPLVDIPYVVKNRLNKAAFKDEELQYQYEKYSDQVSDEFLAMINRKISDKDCYVPGYLSKDENL